MRTNRPLKLAQKTLFVLMICFGLSTLLYAAQNSTTVGGGATVPDNQYHAVIVYKGEYVPTALYYRHRSSQPWMRMSKSDNYQEVVTCANALVKLSFVGQWQGNLNGDGSCGTMIEPATFTLGNRLNYDDSMSGQ